MEELLKIVYTILFVGFSIPIVLGFILRKIAGKHAPEYYDNGCTECARRERKARQRREDQYWRDWWW